MAHLPQCLDHHPPGERLLRRDQHTLGDRPALSAESEAALAGLAPREAPGLRIAVVGGGIAGLTVAWTLARRGHRVTVLDSAALPNRRGSSSDEGRIIRHAYGTMAGYGAMMPAAYQAWRSLFEDTGSVRMAPRRALYILRQEGPWQDAVTATLADAGHSLTVLDEAGLVGFPMVNRQGVLRVVEVGGSGILAAAAILADMLALLSRLGVTVRTGAEVVGLDADKGSLRLESGETIAADHLVVAAGTGAIGLMPEAAGATGLRASLQTLAYLEPPDDLAAIWTDAPLLHARLVDHPAGGIYVLPPSQGGRLKIGDYASATEADPRRDHASLRAERIIALLDGAARVIADFGRYRVTEMRHCHYTMAPEDRFVVRHVGARATLLSACSGHGFKLAPLIALGLAAALEGRLDHVALARWAAGRVGERADG